MMSKLEPHSYSHFLGIDVSKLTLDLCLMNRAGKVLEQCQIVNTCESWIIVKTLIEKYQLTIDEVLICSEHTGMYTYHILSWAIQGAHVWVESGKRIKHSQGIVRGKNDAKDATRIARYALRYVENARLWQPLSETIETLRHLTSLRERLLQAFIAIDMPMKEQKNFMKDDQFHLLEELTDPATQVLKEQIKEQIKAIEERINQTIDSDDNLKNQLTLLDSIPGIATKVATKLIVKTNGFTAFKNARQFACHAGIAPFDYSSGSSVRAKTEVSFHADKELKAVLHLAAMAAIKSKGIIQDYYKRKIAEGKSKMSALNAVRNKIVLIAFAVIKNKILFDNNFHFSFAKS